MKKRPLVDLDQASLDCMKDVAKLAGLRNSQRNMPMRATIQIAIREAMRRALPPGDPRKDPDFHPNHKA